MKWLFLVLMGCTLPDTAQTSAAVTSPLHVVLTFDDTFGEQYTVVAPAIEAHGMRGTFMVNSPRFTWSGYMTLPQVLDLQVRGHEIGGHTLDHLRLTSLSTADQQHQVCDDRAALVGDGLNVTSFAYPFGDDNAALWSVVSGCGYARARDIGGGNNLAGFCGATVSCTTCSYAETVPARTPMSIRTAPTSVGNSCDRANVELAVSDAAAHPVVGQVLVINFHHICDGCDATLAFPPAEFNAFLDWLVASGYTTSTLRDAFP